MEKKIRICKLSPTLCKTNKNSKESGNISSSDRGSRILLMVNSF